MPTATEKHCKQKHQSCQAPNESIPIQWRFSFVNPEAYDKFGWRSRLYKETLAQGYNFSSEAESDVEVQSESEGSSDTGVDWHEAMTWYHQGVFGDQIQPADLLRYVGLGRESQFCGRWSVIRQCQNGHWTGIQVDCGREWCPRCGQYGSQRHMRRASRWVDRVFSMPSVGYWVFQVPLEFRGYFQNKQALQDSRRYLHRLLRREGFQKGVSRWHFYGKTGVGHYHPHLNLLVAGSKVSKRKLHRIRKLWSRWVARYVGSKAIAISVCTVSPDWYNHSDKPGKIWHWIRYVNHSTFTALTPENRQLAYSLIGFHNTSWFGSFSDADKARGRNRFLAWLDSLPDQGGRRSQFAPGVCPECGAEFVKTEVVRIRGDPDESPVSTMDRARVSMLDRGSESGFRAYCRLLVDGVCKDIMPEAQA